MSTPTTKIEMASNAAKPDKKWLQIALIGLIGILLATNLYTLKLYTNCSDSKLVEKEKVNQMQLDSLNLRNIYLTALDSLNQQKTENLELNAVVEEMKADLTKIYDEIGLKVKAGMSDQALTRELDRLSSQMRNSVKEIAALRKDNIALKEKLDAIKMEKDEESKLKKKYKSEKDSLSTVASSTQSKLDNAIAAKVEVDKKMEALGDQIANASYIIVPKLSVTPQKKKRKRAKETTVADKVDYYKICFLTAVNPIIAKGKQVFYLRLLNSVGEPLEIGDEETMANGEPVRYARSVAVDYDGTSKESCVEWEPSNKLKPGKYTLDIFNNNKLVGQSTFSLK